MTLGIRSFVVWSALVLLTSPAWAVVPTDVAGLVAWYDASDATTITSSSGLVSQWNNKKSGATSHVTQGMETNQPQTGGDTINGLNVITFDGTDNFLESTSSDFNFSGSTDLVILVVFESDTGGTRAIVTKDDDLATVSRGFNLFQDTTPAEIGLIIPTSSSERIRRNGRATVNGIGPICVTAVFTGGVTQGIYVNGISDDGTIDGAVPSTIGNNGDPSFFIGRSRTGFYMDGNIAEVLIYEGNRLSESDFRGLYNYLATKWDITIIYNPFRSPDLGDHQGYTTDGTSHYTSDTAAVRKRDNDASWTISTQNTTNLFTGTQNHVGDFHFSNYQGTGYLLAAVDRFNSCSDTDQPTVTVFGVGAGLPRLSTTALGGGIGGGVSGLVRVGSDSVLGDIYAVDFCDGTKIYKYSINGLDASTGISGVTTAGTITLSPNVGNIQGIAHRGGRFYLSTTSSASGAAPQRIWQVTGAGAATVIAESWLPGTAEGIDYFDRLRWLIDDGPGEFVYFLDLGGAMQPLPSSVPGIPYDPLSGTIPGI